MWVSAAPKPRKTRVWQAPRSEARVTSRGVAASKNPKRCEPTGTPHLLGAIMRVLSAAVITLLGVFTLAYGGGAAPKKADVPKYLGMLKNSTSAKDRALAAEMLGKRGAIKASDVADAVDPLKDALAKDKDLGVKKAAAEALGSIGAEPENVVPLLIDALKEKNTPLKMSAIT